MNRNCVPRRWPCSGCSSTRSRGWAPGFAAVEKMRKIAVWVELKEPHHPCMCYHPDAGWLRGHDMIPDKAALKVEGVANARNFFDVDETAALDGLPRAGAWIRITQVVEAGFDES